MSDPTRWFSITQAADAVGRNPQTIRAWIRRGDVPVKRMRNNITGRLDAFIWYTDLMEADRVHNRNMWNKKHDRPLDVA